MDADRKLRVGVIGTGAIAHNAHFPSLASFEDVEVAAVLGGHYENAEKAVRQYGFKKAVRSLDEFLAEDLDAAVLLTPKTVRSEYVLPILEAKLDLLIEKPLGTSMSECAELMAAARESGRITMVAFNRRYSPVHQQGMAEFKDKRPTMVVANKSREFKEYRATLENSIHMVDMLRYILGECVDVQAKAMFTDPFYEDGCTAMFEFEDGGLATMAASREAGQWYERIEMYGDNKTVIMESPDRLSIARKDYTEVYDQTPLHKGWSNYLDAIGFRPCIRHFIDCVKTRQTPMTSIEDAYKTMELMDRLLKAAGLPCLSEEWKS